jgi:hypothetical protein
LERLIVLLRETDMTFVSGRQLVATPDTDILFYRIGNGQRRNMRPVAFCFAIAGDEGYKARAERFLTANMKRTRYGETLRVVLIIDERTDPRQTAVRIAEHLKEDPPKAPMISRFRDVRGAWQAIAIAQPQRMTASAKEAERNADRRAGVVSELQIVKELRGFGALLTQDDFLDERMKTDFMLTALEGVRHFRKLATQVTLRFDDLYKLETYLRWSRGVQRAASGAQRLYVQYRDGISTREVALAIIGHAVSARAKDPAVDVTFLEVDQDGAREFNPHQRIQELRRMADPVLSAQLRRTGTVAKISGAQLVLADERGQRFGAYVSSIVDPELNRTFREIQAGQKHDLIGTKVSFIPGDRPIVNGILPIAKSVLLAGE